jgi:hypothetical protein
MMAEIDRRQLSLRRRAALKKKPVQMQLLCRDRLTEAEYEPYCDLVIAFYEGVRSLPFSDAVKLCATSTSPRPPSRTRRRPHRSVVIAGLVPATPITGHGRAL